MAQSWIELIKKEAPDLGVPDEAVGHLDKFSQAPRRAKLEKAGRDGALSPFLLLSKPGGKRGTRLGFAGLGGLAAQIGNVSQE